MTPSPQTPVLIGAGQVTRHWDGSDASTAPNPSSLRKSAGELALADTGAGATVAAAINHVIVVRTMMDSVPGIHHPFGRCANPPATLAADLGISGAKCSYSVVGGDQPQTLINEAAEAIFSGEHKAVLIAGSEATAAMKTALKLGLALDWSASVDGELDDRGLGPKLLSGYEAANGLGAPTQTYPAFEHALRRRWGLSRAEHAAVMAELWAGFSHISVGHPHAQFPQARNAAFLGNPSAENYPIADPYLKWHVAQDAVNQGAAVILTSLGAAQDMGIDPAKYIYLHGYAKAADRLPTERADLSRSKAMELALAHALTAAGRTTADIAHFDLYSCFPCAVLLAAEALGLDWRTIPATNTGGLPFFGGAGNNYSMHAIATIVGQLRARPEDYGLILANGGFLSKEAVGIYSAVPATDWQPVSRAALQREIDDAAAPVLLSESCTATVDTYSVIYAKGEPKRGYVIASNDNGRVLARVHDRALLDALLADDPVGRTAQIEHRDEVNYLAELA